MKPTALIIRAAGTNCDRELAFAFERAGATTRTLHLNELIASPGKIDSFDLIGFPGGFSYGDDIAAGRIFANRLRQRLFEPLRRAIERRVPMIGICNGFQVLVKTGLLPFPMEEPRQVVTLAANAGGRFIDRWVGLRPDPQSVCIWTKGLSDLALPIAHAEGRFVPADERLLDRLEAGRQIALRYGSDGGLGPAASVNPNGSAGDIAGICDPSGLVLGLMPHPERFTDPTQHPGWTRLGDDFLNATPAGLLLFLNAVEHVVAARCEPAVGG